MKNKGDWSKYFDDMGPEDWEDHFGGPDEDIMEKYYESLVKEPYIEKDSIDKKHIVPYNLDEDNNNINEADSAISIQRKIVSWLSKSKLAKAFINGEGFFVSKGSMVRLKDNAVVDVIAWLLKEGIRSGENINNYNIVYTKPGGKYIEKLSFFKIIVNAPFFSTEMKNSDTNELYNDISFIVDWISKSRLARPFIKGNGFFVLKGPMLQLKDGTIVDVIEWLLKEGICGGETINNYNIVYTKPGGKYIEKLSFFRNIDDAPFTQVQK